MKGAVIFLEPKGTILEVIRKAKSQGYFVVALTSDPSLLNGASEPYNSAISCIDKNIHFDSWSDNAVFDATDRINSEIKIVGIYSGVDPCALLSASLRERYNLPTPTPKNISVILNKFELRKKLVGTGLSNIKSYKSSEVETWTDWKLKGDAYFKPLHGFFSAYVKRCSNLSDFKEARLAWMNGVENESPLVRDYLKSCFDYHLEEAFDGELLSVEAISLRGDFQALGLLSRILYSKNPIVEMGSCFPYPHNHKDKIIEKVKASHEILGFTDGPTHTEVIVSPEGEVEIIDFNPRFVGADVLQSINNAYDIKIEEALLDFALGKEITIKPRVQQFSCIQYVLPPEISKFETIEFPKHPEIKFHTSFFKPGAKISSINRQLDYLGCYLTVMPTFEAAIKRSKELRPEVIINNQYQGTF